MGILDTLLGRKARTAAALADEIAKQEAASAQSRARIEQAKGDRRAAIEAFDDAKHKAADDEIAAAGRDIERRENAIAALKAAHAERVDVEAKEAFRRDVEEAERAATELDAEVAAEYQKAAKTIARLMNAISAASGRKRALHLRAKELGEPEPSYDIGCDVLPSRVGNLPSYDRGGGLLYMNPRELAAFRASAPVGF